MSVVCFHILRFLTASLKKNFSFLKCTSFEKSYSKYSRLLLFIMGPKGKKNQILFIKPDEPAFLKRLKAAAGYKEGPNVDTKVS